MLTVCHACPGFVVDPSASCPHCGAAPKARPSAPTRLMALAAKAAGAGLMMVTLMACYGGGYDDDYYEECSVDADCGPGFVCDPGGFCVGIENCTNGLDDDFDGSVDANDSDCAGVLESSCTNGTDDDGDGATDCEDIDCDASPACEEICNDGVDNDADGAIDCQDDECPPCSGVETNCTNGIDDDFDGVTDCEDTDCTGACMAPVCGDGVLSGQEQCDDGNDLPDDGCDASCFLVFPAACDLIPELVLGESTGETAGTTNIVPSLCGNGAELLFSFVAPTSGTLYVSVLTDVDVALGMATPCTDSFFELACANEGGASVSEAISRPFLAAEEGIVSIELLSPGVVAPYTLTATFVND